MRRRNAILRAVAVAASVIALGGGALAADSLDTAGSVDTDAAGATAAEHATAHAGLPSFASGVIAALVGGSNPSTTASQHDATANASEHASTNAGTNATTKDNDEDTDTDTDTETDTEVSHGQEVGRTGTTATKPGWGCGDDNHTHSGPPGRPGATQPPGCAKHD